MERFGQISLLLLAIFMLTANTYAIQAGGISVYPTGANGSSAPWFHYRVARGNSIEDSLTVENLSGTVADLRLYPVDAAPTGDGGFGMTPEASQPTDAGSWIHLEVSTLHSAPGSHQVIPFRFSVPAAASVGLHYGGVVIQPMQSSITRANGVSTRIVSRIGLRLYETVPGAAHPHVTIEWLHHLSASKRVVLTAALHNDGNTIVTPSGHIEITNEFGRSLTPLRLNTGRSLQPNQRLSSRIPTELVANGLLHRYTVRLHISDSSTTGAHVEVYTISFWVGNTVLTGLSCLTCLLAIALAAVLLHRRAAKKTGAHDSSTNPSQR